MTIRTRFAPSPTGYLHIGGVRTALFNWLLSRREGAGGKFILRIDDTDAERNRPKHSQPILDGFRWLGIHWDEGPDVGGPHAPYFQSQRGDKYKAAAIKLIETGHAYPDYMTKEQLDAARYDQAMAAFKVKNPSPSQAEIDAEIKAIKDGKRPYVFRGLQRDAPPAENLRRYLDKPTTVRLKVPLGRTIVIDDLICGKVEVQSDPISDPVILRGDGGAIYNFATVVDDVDLQITHVLRAREHLSNTPVQILAYEVLGYPLPRFGHIPLVNAPGSKEKLSKRSMKKFVTPAVCAQLRSAHVVPPDWSDDKIKEHEGLNPATVAFYRELGYLPAALVNDFGRLGWSLDDKTEIISLDMMIANFGLERVNDSPASFDPEKLLWLAGEYMRVLPIDEKVAGVLPFLERAGLTAACGLAPEPLRKRVRQVLEACADRIKIYSDIFQYGAFFFRDPVYDPKAVDKRLRPGNARQILAEVRTFLAGIEPFEVGHLEQAIKKYADDKQIKIGDMNHILRVSITGVTVGPGVFECLAILGRDETLRRMDGALKMVG